MSTPDTLKMIRIAKINQQRLPWPLFLSWSISFRTEVAIVMNLMSFLPSHLKTDTLTICVIVFALKQSHIYRSGVKYHIVEPSALFLFPSVAGFWRCVLVDHGRFPWGWAHPFALSCHVLVPHILMGYHQDVWLAFQWASVKHTWEPQGLSWLVSAHHLNL